MNFCDLPTCSMQSPCPQCTKVGTFLASTFAKIDDIFMGAILKALQATPDGQSFISRELAGAFLRAFQAAKKEGLEKALTEIFAAQEPAPAPSSSASQPAPMPILSEAALEEAQKKGEREASKVVTRIRPRKIVKEVARKPVVEENGLAAHAPEKTNESAE